MYLSNSEVRLVTVRKDGSVEILFKNQTYMDIPKEKVEKEEMELKYATGQDAMNCWTLDYGLLKSIQEDMEITVGDSEIPSLEQIEETLLSFERLSKK